jgi:hypothetical protein
MDSTETRVVKPEQLKTAETPTNNSSEHPPPEQRVARVDGMESK